MDSNYELRSSRLERAERAHGIAGTVLAAALIALFITTVLLGASIGDPLFVEDIAAYASLVVALSAIAYILLGFVVAQYRRDRVDP